MQLSCVSKLYPPDLSDIEKAWGKRSHIRKYEARFVYLAGLLHCCFIQNLCI